MFGVGDDDKDNSNVGSGNETGDQGDVGSSGSDDPIVDGSADLAPDGDSGVSGDADSDKVEVEDVILPKKEVTLADSVAAVKFLAAHVGKEAIMKEVFPHLYDEEQREAFLPLLLTLKLEDLGTGPLTLL